MPGLELGTTQTAGRRYYYWPIRAVVVLWYTQSGRYRFFNLPHQCMFNIPSRKNICIRFIRGFWCDYYCSTIVIPKCIQSYGGITYWFTVADPRRKWNNVVRLWTICCIRQLAERTSVCVHVGTILNVFLSEYRRGSCCCHCTPNISRPAAYGCSSRLSITLFQSIAPTGMNAKAWTLDKIPNRSIPPKCIYLF